MFTCNYRLWVIPLIFLSSRLVVAVPMGFEGSVMTMGNSIKIGVKPALIMRLHLVTLWD